MQAPNLISLAEYANRHDIDCSHLRANARAGKLQTAIKIGRNWLISADEPYTDRRVKTGKYIGTKRAKKPANDQDPER